MGWCVYLDPRRSGYVGWLVTSVIVSPDIVVRIGRMRMNFELEGCFSLYRVRRYTMSFACVT